MKLLMHTCCAPCSIECIAALREEGIEPTLFWFNPNIHPAEEYKLRRDTLKSYAASVGAELVVEENYGLREFVRRTSPDFAFGARCEICYEMRLSRTAAFAKEEGFDSFTTTLLVSPYQNREKLLAAGEAAAAREGVAFLGYDFRPRFQRGQEKAAELGLYRQKYCGCIFSEEERFSNRAKKALRRGETW
ncbi:MAG: epoxyqueuosine reductase QueH [Clostridia bacterium]|nr:epoxyqueuosine reductase QueH [Clostridia bacterium]MBR5742308.1 epoxyqueuosine reductase QueH [Clostridia bacterium]